MVLLSRLYIPTEKSFSAAFDILADNNLLKNIPPISNNKHNGIIRIFNDKIPHGYGTSVYSNLQRNEYLKLEDFLEDFFDKVAMHSKWGDNSRELQMIFTPSSDQNYYAAGIQPDKNELLNVRAKANHFQNRSKLHMIHPNDGANIADSLEEQGYDEDEMGLYLADLPISEFQNQSQPIHDDHDDYDEVFPDSDYQLKDPEKYLNYVAPVKEVPKTIPPAQHSYQKLLQRPKDDGEKKSYNSYNNQKSPNPKGLVSMLPCRNELYAKCPFSNDPSKCRFSHDAKELVKLWNTIQMQQKTSKYAQGSSHQDS